MSEDSGNKNQAPFEGDAYEKRDISTIKVIATSGVIIVIIVVILILLNEYFLASKESMVYEQELAPISVALRELRARELETLGSYKVLSAEQGIYQIPIDRAMQLVADEAFAAGAPARER